MRKNLKTFFISYANLNCRVEAPCEWSKYFKKLYENSDIVNYSEYETGNFQAKLLIRTVKSKGIFVSFHEGADLKKYFIKAPNTPIFLFPTVHQFISRIFNILFHLSGGFVLHSSSILIGNKAILFVGESGRGKSTIVDLIHSANSKYQILSDNSVFIKKNGKHFVVFPSPYLEANRLDLFSVHLSKKPPYEVKTVFFPYHSKINAIKNLSFEKKIELLQKNSHIPYSPEKLFNREEIANFGKLFFDFVDLVGMFKLEFVNSTKFVKKIIKYVKYVQ